MPSPTRRTVLALGALAGALLAAGCSEDHRDADRTDRPDPDLPLRLRAVASTDRLLTDYDAVIAGPGADRAAALRDLRADVEEHRAALAAGLPTPSPSGSTPSSATASATAAPAAGVAALAAAERRTAAERLADLEAASPALARLLASVAASGALHARALGDPGPIAPPAPTATAPGASASVPVSPSAAPAGAPPTGAAPSGSAGGSASGRPAPLPTGAVAALQAALSAEHAAVYGYGVVGARTPAGPQRDAARAGYAAHQARRDALQRELDGAGATPTAAAAGYRLPFAVSDAAGAGQLAAHIETQLTAVWADTVAGTGGALRQTAATALRETALRAAQWGADLSALPGLPEQDAADGAGTTPGTSASASG
ncbi:ferritin-like domain-containing protein [Kitasatospora sp. NPDC085895]|uniref:ferritin-like domain-containing protein n=1 Tax=Kitasatospora sp. NPDC085895 TaxID=3155057 RepID=UPI00344BF0E6